MVDRPAYTTEALNGPLRRRDVFVLAPPVGRSPGRLLVEDKWEAAKCLAGRWPSTGKSRRTRTYWRSWTPHGIDWYYSCT